MLDPPFCQACATPIGTLRQDHLKALLDLELPGLEKGDVGLIFTHGNIHDDIGNESESQEAKRIEQDNNEKEHSDFDVDADNSTTQTSRSPYFDQVAWCSKDCWNKGRALHSWVCSSDDSKRRLRAEPRQQIISPCSKSKRRLQQFLEQQDNPKIFELATQAILFVLIASASRTSSSYAYNYLLWEDYGSHPLWWTIGEEKNRSECIRCSQEFAGLLRHWLEHSLSSVQMTEEERQTADEQRLGQQIRRRCDMESPALTIPKDIETGSQDATISNRHQRQIENEMLPSQHGIANHYCSVDKIGAFLGILKYRLSKVLRRTCCMKRRSCVIDKNLYNYKSMFLSHTWALVIIKHCINPTK